MDRVIVTAAGILTIGWIVWFFLFSKKKQYRAAVSSGIQEVFIRVKGGYDPDVIVAKAGKPLRLVFKREEEASCTEMVVFGAFNKSAKLPPYEEVVVELLPEKPGEYDFSCQMGMIRGKLIVEE
ncbi:MAG TPA: cupredoxin domain-containing protein [Nitrospirae bacterium]|nr:cupredoxin domain-containing protein [Nitrospirota bacterium]